jgi:hypothetical protein
LELMFSRKTKSQAAHTQRYPHTHHLQEFWQYGALQLISSGAI